MSIPTREQIIDIIAKSGNNDWNYAILDNAGLKVAADAILALFAEQAARVVELEARIMKLEHCVSTADFLSGEKTKHIAELEAENARLTSYTTKYANHVTTELQAKITKLEDDTTVLCTSVLRYRDRIAALEAELTARDFVPITDVHKDGKPWLVSFWLRGEFIMAQGVYSINGLWVTQEYAPSDKYTHAAPLPQPPKEGE